MSLRTQVTKYERRAATQKPESEIDKIKLWYLQQRAVLLPHDELIELTPLQEEKRDKLRYIWKLLISMPKENVIDFCENEYQISHRQAWNYVNHAQKLFGNIEEADKKADRSLLIAQREAIIQMIKDDDKIEAKDKFILIDRNMEAIEKMKDAYDPIELSAEDILDKLKLPDVTISSSPEILHG